MRKINDIDEVKDLINTRFGKEYIMTSIKSIEYYNDNIDNLFVHEENSDLFILKKKGNHYIMDAYFKKNSTHSLDINTDIILEYAYRKPSEIHKIMSDLNFIEAKNRKKLISKDFYGSSEVEILGKKYTDTVVKEINNNFDPYYGCPVDKKIISKKIDNDEVLALMMYNEIVGITEITRNKTKIIIDHIMVCDKFKNKGYSKKLLDGLFKYAKDRGINIIELFVNTDNESAIKMYEGMGFTYGNYNSTIFRRKKNER